MRAQILSHRPKVLFVAPSMRALTYFKNELSYTTGESLRSEGYLADAIPWWSCAESAVIGPVLGGPAVLLAVKPFLVEGISRIVFLGTAAALDVSMSIGDIVLPLSTYSDRERRVAGIAGHKLHDLLRHYAFLKAEAVHLAQCLCAEDPYQTSDSKRQWALAQGLRCVEMELYQLAQLCHHHQQKLLAALVISDRYVEQTHERGLSAKAVKQTLKKVSSKLVQTYAR